MNVLLIGAGSVGQVLGYYLNRGGTRVTFFAPGDRAHRIEHGLVLSHLNLVGSKRRMIRFDSYKVISDHSRIDDQEWDQIYFCIPSDALKDRFLKEISRRSGKATIIKLQPGLCDRQIYTRFFDETQLVSGMVSFISSPALLPQELIAQPSMGYWLPPILSIPFSGPTNRVKAVVKALNDGGLRARVHPDVESLVGFVLAVQAPLTAGFECSQWSIKVLRTSPTLKAVCRSIKEATAIVSKYHQTNPPRIMKLIRCSFVRLGLSILPWGYPFNIEKYLRAHYKKLHKQSRRHLDDYIEQGRHMDLPYDSLLDLRVGLE